MVYNALKLFMEINPDLFDEAMQQYKQKKAEYVFLLDETILPKPNLYFFLGNDNTRFNVTRPGRR
jgi:hypothetical protein